MDFGQRAALNIAMNPTLVAFAEIYLRSAHAKKGGSKDYTIDFEKFLRSSGFHDGDERELAVRDLIASERASEGLFIIERNKRSGIFGNLRLKMDGGERWICEITGCLSPSLERRNLAEFFATGAEASVPEIYRESWRSWFEELEVQAKEGGSVVPFKRDDLPGNEMLLKSLIGVINWDSEALIKRASSVITGDSKLLGKLKPRLVAALVEVTAGDRTSLPEFGILDAPRSAWFHGPLELVLPQGRFNAGVLAGPIAISSADLDSAISMECRAEICVTVENECLFHDLIARRLGVLLIWTSFPGSATRSLIDRLPSSIRFFHFGDSDPAGFAILMDLRERTGRDFRPLMMKFRGGGDSALLSEMEKRTAKGLLSAGRLPNECLQELEKMLMAGAKGDFEQESLPIETVGEEIRNLTHV